MPNAYIRFFVGLQLHDIVNKTWAFDRMYLIVMIDCLTALPASVARIWMQ